MNYSDEILRVQDLLTLLIQSLSNLMSVADSQTRYSISELLTQLSELRLKLDPSNPAVLADPKLVAQFRNTMDRLAAFFKEFKQQRLTPLESANTMVDITSTTANLTQSINSLIASRTS
jgi:hypothetical protein